MNGIEEEARRLKWGALRGFGELPWTAAKGAVTGGARGAVTGGMLGVSIPGVGMAGGGIAGAAAGAAIGAALKPLTETTKKLNRIWERLIRTSQNLIRELSSAHTGMMSLRKQWELSEKRIKRLWGTTLYPITRDITRFGMEFRERWARIKIEVFRSFEGVARIAIKMIAKLTSMILSVIETFIKMKNFIVAFVRLTTPIGYVFRALYATLKTLLELLGLIKPPRVGVRAPKVAAWPGGVRAGEMGYAWGGIAPGRVSELGMPPTTGRLEFDLGAQIRKLNEKLNLGIDTFISWGIKKITSMFAAWMAAGLGEIEKGTRTGLESGLLMPIMPFGAKLPPAATGTALARGGIPGPMGAATQALTASLLGAVPEGEEEPHPIVQAPVQYTPSKERVTINVLDSSQLLELLKGSWEEILFVLRQQQAEYDLLRFKLRSEGSYL